jgi:hypothetical protein
MIDCIFTLDYEIYGNGEGTLDDLVRKPADELKKVFRNWDAKFVIFAEVAELETIEKWGTDPAIGLVKQQLRDFYRDGFEIGLHLHPQWCDARYEQGRWRLDFNEYNLCALPRARIAAIVEGSIGYLRHALGHPDFTPLSFRAGNWLFQPTRDAADVLAQHGIRIDSSVFKGGLQRNVRLDYRRALKNGYYWSFDGDVNEPVSTGPWIEVPVYTEMVRPWRMLTSKRLSFGNGSRIGAQSVKEKLNRRLDLLRLRYPLKLDFCRMTLGELTSMIEGVMREDREEPKQYRPLVAIGHTKDLTDPDTVDAFLSFLRANDIAISTFETAHPRLTGDGPPGSQLTHAPRARKTVAKGAEIEE